MRIFLSERDKKECKSKRGIEPTVGNIVGPEREIIAEQLHDESRIFITIFGECVKLSDSVVER